MIGDARLAYVAEHIEQRLATDERVHALDIQVLYVHGQLILAGQVFCESRRNDVEQVARECAPPGVNIVNNILVARVEGSIDEELVE